jgi:superfamily II DNA or RNA helicase
MKISSVLSSDFEYGIRSRGAEYFRSGAVRIKLGSATEVHAKVRGTQFYEVTITWEAKSGLELWCDCPYFDSQGPCKHLWATVLAAEARGFLNAVSNRDSFKVSYDLPDEDGTDDPDEYGALEQPPPYQRPQFVPRTAAPAPPKAALWQQRLNEVAAAAAHVETWPSNRQLLYVVDVPSSVSRGALILQLLSREPKLKGGWRKPVVPRLTRATASALPDPADRHLLSLISATSNSNDWMYSYLSDTLPSGYRILYPFSATVMPLMAATNRLLLQITPSDPELLPLVWDEGDAWQFHLRLGKQEGRKRILTGCLRRHQEEMDVRAPLLVTEGGLVFTSERVSRLEEGTSFPWIVHLRRTGRIEASDGDAGQLVAALLEHPFPVRLELPEEFRYQEERPTPRPCLTVRAVKTNPWEAPRLRAQLWFDYEGKRVSSASKTRGIYDDGKRIFVVRDRPGEEAAQDHLRQLGLSGPSQEYQEKEPAWGLVPKKLPGVVRACLEAGWHIEAEGKTFRRPGTMQVKVSSGVDWFELHGEIEYGDTIAKLPAVLAALRRGDNMVQLDDGTYGLLPEDWLKRWGSIAELGRGESDHLRFQRNQAGLLDALLAAQPEVRYDEAFARVREELRGFAGIRSVDQPTGFIGQLRDYQRAGIGWMEFLRRFGFGGCLADDMGVGKTAQVLALIESRRELRADPEANGNAPCGPSLVVVPKSLVFNWKQEAARFTPRLRVLDHTGASRNVHSFAGYDVILTTYGTLRRDAVEFKDLEFDYIVLDEAQAVKNAGTESAKAVRLLRGRHRLALSGTPVENHLGELWSLFEFLNPGMLGAASVFKLAGGVGRNPPEEMRSLLAQALRPFILRRTKQQVARELPEKTEQTIFCELEAPQRKLYNELRNHYRDSLLHRIATEGMAKSKIQVLEALLRLRQAACHPGLLNPKCIDDASAKLDLLIEQLGEITEGRHKALVFSQFTSLLAILRKRLDAARISYEYLDGVTRDRQQRVERFQNDADCGLFLISLKAGGLGLNLTAAEYVFLLDPWWNPAVEAQAVDRAHRIGQTRQVFAYRLIARDTVEEKVLQLQNTKRDLAAAIINADNSPLTNLQRDDLELLLS